MNHGPDEPHQYEVRRIRAGEDLLWGVFRREDDGDVLEAGCTSRALAREEHRRLRERDRNSR